MKAPEMQRIFVWSTIFIRLVGLPRSPENQTKQAALLGVSGVPARKEFLLRGADYYYQAGRRFRQKLKVGNF